MKILWFNTLFLLLTFCSGCGAVKFTAGMAANSLTHQTGHYLGCVATGTEVRWRDGFGSIPGMQPVTQINETEPEPLAFGGGLLLQGLVSELIMSQTDVLKDGDGKKFMTDFWMGFLAGAAFDELNYGVRRSGLFGDHKGEGQNDLNKDKFGEYHKLAGAASAAHGARIAYKLAKGQRTEAYWTKIKIWVNGLYMGLSYVF